jgi:cell division protein ZapA
MATVNVTVNGRAYTVGCEDGQEEHVKSLAEQFDKQVQDIAEQVGAVGELRLFLLAALTTADELQEARQRAERLASGRGFPATATMPADSRVEQRAAAALESAAQRLEQLAEQVA